MFNSNNLASRVYFDITVSNLNSTSLTSNPYLKFTETRSIPFVQNPSQYFFSIVRFSLDTNSLPIFVPTIQASQSDANLTIYSLSMTYNNITVQSYIEFIPQDTTQSLPTAPSNTSTGLQVFTDYYYVYNYEYLIYLMNNTLKSCFNSLASQTALPTANIPYLKWDSVNNIATLITDQAGFNDQSDDYISLYFNNALYQLFPSFPSFVSNSISTSGLNYIISCSSYGIADTITKTTYTALSCVQEYSTISIWNPVASIVFTSNTLPIVAENLSSPLVFMDGQTLQSTNGSNIANIITDFESNTGIYKSSLVYQPYIFRYKQLMGTSALYNLDIQCFWKNRFGSLIPFKLNAGNTATVKICFSLLGTEN
jgi:hypothetical protein